jgi:serine/threonine protein kinase
VIWRQLFHPNLLPFYGVYRWVDQPKSLCLVSPFMENGTIMRYLERHPNADRINLVCSPHRSARTCMLMDA